MLLTKKIISNQYFIIFPNAIFANYIAIIITFGLLIRMIKKDNSRNMAIHLFDKMLEV